MKINWKLRLKNKATLIALFSTLIGLVYSILAAFDVVPSVQEAQIVQWISIIISLLATLGIINDPTTPGVCDSREVLEYKEPQGKG